MATWDELKVLMSQVRFSSARGVVHSVEPPDEEAGEAGYETVRRFVVRGELWKVTTVAGDLVGLHDGSRVLLCDDPTRPPRLHPASQAPYVLHEPLDVVRAQDLNDWRRGEDYAIPAASPERTQLLGRTCWRVDLLPPSHKSGLLCLWIDAATGIRLRTENSEVGLLDEILELKVDAIVPDAEFVLPGFA